MKGGSSWKMSFCSIFFGWVMVVLGLFVGICLFVCLFVFFFFLALNAGFCFYEYKHSKEGFDLIGKFL